MTRDRLVQLRVQAGEQASFRQAAAQAGLSVSGWARERLRRAAARELSPPAGAPLAAPGAPLRPGNAPGQRRL